MNHIRAKLRATFDDPIRVKSQGAMVRTAKAMEIVGLYAGGNRVAWEFAPGNRKPAPGAGIEAWRHA